MFPIQSSAVSKIMNNKFFTGMLIAAAAITSAFAQTSSASAFEWNNTWQQPQIFSGAAVGFDHKPFQQFVNAERVAIPDSGQKKIDVNNLFLKYDHNVQVSFINEGAGYHNQLGFSAKGATNTSGMLFNDIACAGSYDSASCIGGWDNANTLKFGDTVKTGMIKGGTQLDFGLSANGYYRGADTYVFGTKDAENADKLNHVVAYTYGQRYLLMGFEDLYGNGQSAQGKFGEWSDRDFNDTVFVVDIGEANVACLNAGTCQTKTPEPAAAAGLVSMLGAAAAIKRRRHG
jgi:Domain of unknown function (DUF4114)